MPSRSLSTEYFVLSMLGLLAAVVLATLIYLGKLQQEEEQRAWIRTTHSRNVDGALVYYTLLERLGLNVARSERPLLDDALDDAGVLYIVDPLLHIHGGEVGHLLQWVKEGGVLVCTWRPGQLVRAFGSVGSGSCRLPPPETVEDDEAADEEQEQARNVENEEAKEDENKVLKVAVGASELPLARDVRTVHFERSRLIQTEDAEPVEGYGEMEALFRDETGTRVASRALGEGAIILVSDSSFFSNELIGEENNSILAANLAHYALARSGGSRILFDEYHFGYGAHETGWGIMQGMIFRTSPGWAVLSFAAAGLLFLVYKGRRFGTRRAPGRLRRRSRLEFVDAVGATYRAAGAHGLVLERNITDFRRRAAELVGMPVSDTDEELARRLAQRTGAGREYYLRFLHASAKAVTRPFLSRQHVQGLYRQLVKIESEIFYGTS